MNTLNSKDMNGVSVVDDAIHPNMTRRSAVMLAAWSVPVIALAVATPAHAASTDVPLVTICGGNPGDNGTYAITQPTADKFGSIVVLFDDVSKFMPAGDVNVDFANGVTLGWHFDNYPSGNLNDKTFQRMPTVPIIANGGKTLTIILPLVHGSVVKVQVHTFNTHAGTAACPIKA